MTDTNKVAYEGLNKINELKLNFIVDIMSGENEVRDKVNELIRKFNLMVDILNGQIR